MVENLYGVGGMRNASPPVLNIKNDPPATFRGQLGQLCYNTLQSPPSLFIYDGMEWVPANFNAGFPITPYVVGPPGQAHYQTIQSAIDAANAQQGSVGANIFIQPGTYNENLTLFQNINLIAFGGDAGAVELSIPTGDDCSVIVNGSLTLDVSALPTLSFNTCENIRFSPPTGNVVKYYTNVNLLPPSTLLFKGCILQGSQFGSFIFNCDGFPVLTLIDSTVTEVTPNNVNLFELPGANQFFIMNGFNTVFDVNGVNPCVVVNTSDIHFFMTSCTWRSMINLTGANVSNFTFQSLNCYFDYTGSAQLPLFNYGPCNGNIQIQGGIFAGGSGSFSSSTAPPATDVFFLVNDVQFFVTAVCANNCKDQFFGCNFLTHANPAINMSSASNVSVTSCVINSTNNPSITGSGSGILTLNDISWLSNSNVAGTLTLGGTTLTPITNTSLSTGTLSIKSTSVNNGNNAGFIEMIVGGATVFVPYFSNISP